MLIDVSQMDVAGGVKFSSDFCPIALALRRQFPRRRFSVHPPFIFIEEGNVGSVIGLLGPKATWWSVKFDNGEIVEPIKLEPIWVDKPWDVITGKASKSLMQATLPMLVEEYMSELMPRLSTWRWQWEMLA